MKNRSATAFAYLLQQFVAANAIAGFFRDGNLRFGFRSMFLWNIFEKMTHLIMRSQQRSDLAA